MNLLPKQKESHRHRKQTYSYHEERGWMERYIRNLGFIYVCVCVCIYLYIYIYIDIDILSP